MMGGYVLGCLGGIYTRSFIQHLFYFLKAEILEAMPLILQFMVLMKENSHSLVPLEHLHQCSVDGLIITLCKKIVANVF